MTTTIIGEQHLHKNGNLTRDTIIFRDPEGRVWHTAPVADLHTLCFARLAWDPDSDEAHANWRDIWVSWMLTRAWRRLNMSDYSIAREAILSIPGTVMLHEGQRPLIGPSATCELHIGWTPGDHDGRAVEDYFDSRDQYTNLKYQDSVEPVFREMTESEARDYLKTEGLGLFRRVLKSGK